MTSKPQRRSYPCFALLDALDECQTEVTHAEFTVLFNLWLHADDQGFAWPTRATLAERSGMDPASITRILRSLRERGLIHMVEPGSKSRKRSTCYRLFPDRQVPSDHPQQVTSDHLNEVSTGDLTGDVRSHQDPKTLRARYTENSRGTELQLGGSTPRKPDYLFEALLEVCGWELSHLTKSERGEANRSCSELRAIHATPDQVHAHARRYRTAWPRMELTPSALVHNWNRFNGRGDLAPSYDTPEARAELARIDALPEDERPF